MASASFAVAKMNETAPLRAYIVPNDVANSGSMDDFPQFEVRYPAVVMAFLEDQSKNVLMKTARDAGVTVRGGRNKQDFICSLTMAVCSSNDQPCEDEEALQQAIVKMNALEPDEKALFGLWIASLTESIRNDILVACERIGASDSLALKEMMLWFRPFHDTINAVQLIGGVNAMHQAEAGFATIDYRKNDTVEGKFFFVSVSAENVVLRYPFTVDMDEIAQAVYEFFEGRFGAPRGSFHLKKGSDTSATGSPVLGRFDNVSEFLGDGQDLFMHILLRGGGNEKPDAKKGIFFNSATSSVMDEEEKKIDLNDMMYAYQKIQQKEKEAMEKWTQEYNKAFHGDAFDKVSQRVQTIRKIRDNLEAMMFEKSGCIILKKRCHPSDTLAFIKIVDMRFAWYYGRNDSFAEIYSILKDYIGMEDDFKLYLNKSYAMPHECVWLTGWTFRMTSACS